MSFISFAIFAESRLNNDTVVSVKWYGYTYTCRLALYIVRCNVNLTELFQSEDKKLMGPRGSLRLIVSVKT